MQMGGGNPVQKGMGLAQQGMPLDPTNVLGSMIGETVAQGMSVPGNDTPISSPLQNPWG